MNIFVGTRSQIDGYNCERIPNQMMQNRIRTVLCGGGEPDVCWDTTSDKAYLHQGHSWQPKS